MATAQFWYGQNATTGTVASTITALQAVTDQTQRCLVIMWNDLKPSLHDSNTANPDTGEDWVAGTHYYQLDKTTNSTSADRKAEVILGNIALDQGFYLDNQNLIVRSLTVNIYSQSSINIRPSASEI